MGFLVAMWIVYFCSLCCSVVLFAFTVCLGRYGGKDVGGLIVLSNTKVDTRDKVDAFHSTNKL